VNVVHNKQRPEIVNCPVWLVTRTCFVMGKRWIAGSKIAFNHDPPSNLKKHMVEIGRKRVSMIPTDELQYDFIGREPTRPSEYQEYYEGEIPEEVG
jgi:hypothetical protein